MSNDISIDEMVRQRIEAERQAKASKDTQAQPETENTGSDNGEIPRKFVRDCLNANQEGDGILFAALHDGKFIFNMKSQRWHKWAGHYWAIDTMDESLSAVANVAQRYLEEAKDIVSDINNAMKNKETETADALKGIQDSIYKRVNRLRSENGRKNCRSFAQANNTHALAMPGDDLDQNPWLFACANGVIDLRTGDLRPGRCDDMISKASPVEYPGIEAEAPVFKKILFEIFDGDQELVDYLQRLLGYSITGLAIEAVLPIMWGQGRNGKTTIVEMIKSILGPMSAPIQSEMLLDQGRTKSASSASPDIMALKGLRIAFGSEADEGRRFSPAKVKWLSGSDTLVGRSLYDRDDTYFTPTHTLVLLTNHKPHAPANDFAFWERVHLIPFTLSFVDRAPQRDNERAVDKSVGDKLKMEAPGILAWLVRGCLKWQRDGLSPPKVILDATKEYKQDEDLLADFLDQRCHISAGAEAPATELYDGFKEWFAENVSKQGTFSQKKFGNLMKDRFDKVKRGTYFYQGLRLMTA